MAKKTKTAETIIAVAYCRKSTLTSKTEKSIADQRARISKLTPPTDGTVYQIVRWYENDKGIPGWKRGAERPDYFKLVGELKQTGAVAVLVDDFDRFSRADPMETISDVQALRELGVRWLHAVNQGCRDLVAGGGMVTMQIAMEANASHEFSTRLSRRIANARLDAAKKGLRSGGIAPYGMENDGKGGLKHGDPKQVKIVRQIFDWFVNKLQSMCWIASELNRKKIPARHGGLWAAVSVKQILQRREYKGDLSYNRRKSGTFHIVNGDHEVVPVYQTDERKPWQATEDGLVVKHKVYQPIVSAKVFDAAQRRLAGFALNDGRRPRSDGFALSGVLACDHCGRRMSGCRPTGRGQRVYRCSSNKAFGPNTCGSYTVDEAVILPLLMRLLGEEITDLHQKLTAPPPELVEPRKHEAEHREGLEKERAELAKKIARDTERILDIEDKATRQTLDHRITEMRDRLAQLDTELTGPSSAKPGVYTDSEIEALAKWWDDFNKRAVSVPVKGNLHPVAHLYQAPEADEQAILLDARVVNEALHGLGCEVRLRWKTEKITLSNGKQQGRHTLLGGRLRLGQYRGKITAKSGQMDCHPQHAADRTWTRFHVFRNGPRRALDRLRHVNHTTRAGPMSPM